MRPDARTIRYAGQVSFKLTDEYAFDAGQDAPWAFNSAGRYLQLCHLARPFNTEVFLKVPIQGVIEIPVTQPVKQRGRSMEKRETGSSSGTEARLHNPLSFAEVSFTSGRNTIESRTAEKVVLPRNSNVRFIEPLLTEEEIEESQAEDSTDTVHPAEAAALDFIVLDSTFKDLEGNLQDELLTV